MLSLNRPEKRNAINDLLLLELETIFDKVPAHIKCILIKGNGLHFSAGLDLSELKEKNSTEGIYHSRMWHRVMDKIQTTS